MIEAFVEMFASRAYVGAGALFAFFALSAWFVFVPFRKLCPVKLSRPSLCLLTFAVFTVSLYAGVKPEPPGPGPGPDFGITNAIVIPSKRVWKNSVWELKPNGEFHYFAPTNEAVNVP